MDVPWNMNPGDAHWCEFIDAKFCAGAFLCIFPIRWRISFSAFPNKWYSPLLCALCIFPIFMKDQLFCISKWFSPPLLWSRPMHIGPSLSGRRTQEQALGRRLRFRGTFWSGRDISSFYVLSKGAHEWVEWSYIGFQICSSCWTYKHQFKGYKIKRCQGLQVQRFPKIQAKIRSTGAGDPFSDMELHQS